MICKKHNVEKEDFCVNINTGQKRKMCPECVQDRRRKREKRMRIEEIRNTIKRKKNEIKELIFLRKKIAEKQGV